MSAINLLGQPVETNLPTGPVEIYMSNEQAREFETLLAARGLLLIQFPADVQPEDPDEPRVLFISPSQPLMDRVTRGLG